MPALRFARTLTCAGFLYAALMVVQAFGAGAPPRPGASAESIVRYVTDHNTAIRWTIGYLGGLGYVTLLGWLGALWRAMRVAERNDQPGLSIVSVAGGVVVSAVSIVGIVLMNAIAVGVAELSPREARFMYLVSSNTSAAAAFGIAASAGAAGALFWRSRYPSRAAGFFGVIVAVTAAVGVAGIASTSDVFFYVGFLGYVGYAVWIVWVSAAVLRYAPETPNRFESL